MVAFVILFYFILFDFSLSNPHCGLIHEPEAWRLAVKFAVESVTTPVPHGHVYEVGVYTGSSMIFLQQQLNPPMIWGFDSFEGLPPSNEELVSEWHEGKYSDDPRERLLGTLGNGRHGWVAGFYSESLSPEKDSQVTMKGMKPAQYIDIDCDLYESTRDALDFFFRNGLVVPGTVIGYDDWWVLPCGDGNDQLSSLSVGEGRAHLEMTKKYGVHFKCVSGPCSLWKDEKLKCKDYIQNFSWGVMFEVMSIYNHQVSSSNSNQPSSSPIEHGFEMSVLEENYFVQTNSLCQTIRLDGAVYTLRSGDEEELARHAELILSRSGLKLKINYPVQGASITHYVPSSSSITTVQYQTLPFSVFVDVSEDGFDSIKIRRDPSDYQLCYSAIRASEHVCNSQNINVSISRFFQNMNFQQPKFKPKCYPISRGIGALDDVIIPTPKFNGKYYGINAVAAWIKKQVSFSSVHEFLGFHCLELNPSFETLSEGNVEVQIFNIDHQYLTYPPSSLPSSFSGNRLDITKEFIEYDNKMKCIDFSNRYTKEIEIVSIPIHSDGTTDDVISFNKPQCGDSYTGEMEISLDVNLFGFGPGVQIIHQNLDSFHLCYGVVTTIDQLLSQRHQQHQNNSPGVCLPLRTASSLPNLIINDEFIEQQKNNMNHNDDESSSRLGIQVEAWLVGEDKIQQKEVVVGRTNVVLI